MKRGSFDEERERKIGDYNDCLSVGLFSFGDFKNTLNEV